MWRSVRRSAWLRGRAGLAVLVAAAMAAGAGLAAARAGFAEDGRSLSVDTSACGTPAEQLPAGPLAFSVTDRAPGAFVSVYLTDPDNGDVYAEIPWLAPRHTLPLTTTLSGGHYALRCVFSDGTVRTSRRITVTGTASAAVAGYKPLPDLDMTAPVNAYRRWISAALPKLLAAARVLDADTARDDLTAARADWLTAHLDYERLGAAYNAFGDFDDAIDGTAQGLPQGVDSPDWTGFFRVEYGLWHGQAASRLHPLTHRLVSDVSALIRDFPSEDVDPGDLPLRAHEILENALQFQLTGDDDYGSGTTLATVDANVQGTRQVLDVLEPLIRPRDPALLAVIDQDLSRVDADVTAFRAPGGTWTPLRRISADRRQRIDGDMGELLEQLSAVPNLLAPRTSA